MAGLNFDFTGNPASLVSAAEQSRAALKGLEKQANDVGMSIDNFLGATKGFVASMTGIGVGVAGLQQFAKNLVNVRSEFQDTEARLKVFLKSEEAAATMMDDLADLAWNNTFEFTDITKAAAQLLAFKTDAKDVGDVITRLSEIASGTGVALGDMVEKFNKAKSTGKVGSDLQEQFAGMGIDLKTILADINGRNRSDYEGVTLTFNDLQTAIRHVTDEGGMFFGMMKERGKNISDSIAGVRDNLALLMNEMGKELQGPIKSGIDEANEGIEYMMEHWQEVAKAIGGAIVAVGSYKAAMMTMKGIEQARQKVNFLMEKQELEKITQATNEQYKLEIAELEKKVASGQAAANADIQIALAKKQLNQEQADEIIKLREAATAQAEVLIQKANAAKEEQAIAAQELLMAQQRENNAQNAVSYWQDEIKSIDEKIASLGDEISEQQLSSLATKKQTAQENLNTASKNLNAASSQKAAAADRAEATAKIAESTAANADTAAQARDAIGKTVNARQTKALAKAQLALKAIMQATGLSMLANPYVIAAAGVAALVFGLYKLWTAETAAEKAAKKFNSELEKQKSLSNSLKSSLDNSDSVISSNTTDVRIKQKEFDDMLYGRKTYYKDDGKTKKPEEEQNMLREIEKKYAEHYGTLEAMEAASEEERQAYRSKLEADFLLQQKKNDYELAVNRKKEHEQYNKQLRESGADVGYIDIEADELIISNLKEDLDNTVESYKNASRLVDEINEKQSSGLSNLQVEKQIKEAELALDAARLAYYESASEINSKALIQAESDLNILRKKYKDQTDKEWVDTKKMNEERKKALRELANEETRIRNSAIDDQRKKRKAEYEQTIEEIKQEEAEYKRTHNGRGSGTLNKKLSNAKMQFDLDMANLDKQWKEWLSSHNKDVIHLQLDVEMENLQRMMDNATTSQQFKDAQGAYRKAEDKRMVMDNRDQADNEILSKLGGNRDLLEKYTQNKGAANLADILGIDQQTVSELTAIEDHYATILKLQQSQKAGQRSQEDLRSEIDGMDNYMSASVEAQKAYYDRIAQIKEKYGIDKGFDLGNADTSKLGGNVAAEVEFARQERDIAVTKAGQENGVPSGEAGALMGRLSSLIVDYSTITTEQVRAIYDSFLQEVDGKIAAVDQQIAEKTGQLYMTDENGNVMTDENGQSMMNEGLTDEERLEIETRINELYAQRTELTNMQTQAQQNQGEAIQNTQGKLEKFKENFIAASSRLENGFAAISSSAKTLSSTFGGAMSKNGRKAMDAIGGIADAAGSTMSTLKTLIPTITDLFKNVGATGTAIQTEEAAVSVGTSTAMAGTATAAATAIKTVETASVILTVISLALQVIQAIVNVASQYTAEAQLQEQIDEDIERVNALKDEQEKLNEVYKSKAGTEYYRGMAKAAKHYSETIEAQEKTVRDAEKLTREQESKHSSDSDKVKDAKEQEAEQKKALEDMKREQEEMYKELANDLLTTDLRTFSENLADTMFDAFSDGMEGIEGAWEDTLDNLQRDMMKKGLSIALENLFSGIWEDMKQKTMDGELTQGEIDQIMRDIESQSQNAKNITEAYYNALNERGLLSDEDVEASTGGFDSMTQDQADELSARFTALQIEGANVVTSAQAMLSVLNQLGVNDALKMNIYTQILQQNTLATEIAQNQLDELRNIVANTASLADTNKRIKAIEQKMSEL